MLHRQRMAHVEWGDSEEATQVLSPATGLTLADPGLHKVAASLLYPERNPERVATTRVEAPAVFKQAQAVEKIRSAVNPPVKWVDLKNGRVIVDSVGAGGYLPNGAVVAVVKDIANGLFAPPRIYPMNVVDPTTFDFFPTFALELGNGGPLPAGELFRWIGTHIRLSSSVLNAQPGLQVEVRIEFGPAAFPGSLQTLIFEAGIGTAPVEMTIIHGVINNSGFPMLRTPTLAVQPGVPVIGADFPRISIVGAPTADYECVYRFLLPGDAPTDKFMSYMR